MKPSLLLPIFVSLVGCVAIELPDGGTDGGVALWPEGTLELGGGDATGAFTAFTAFPAEVQATPGAQGGFHVGVRYKITGKALPTVRFEHRVTRVRDDVLVSKGARVLDVDPVAAGESWTSQETIIIFICPTPVGVNVLNEELRFEVTALKNGAVLNQTSANATFRCAAGDGFCASICAG